MLDTICTQSEVCVCAWTSIHLLAFLVHLCVHEECQAYLTLTSHILCSTMLFLNMVEAEDWWSLLSTALTKRPLRGDVLGQGTVEGGRGSSTSGDIRPPTPRALWIANALCLTGGWLNRAVVAVREGIPPCDTTSVQNAMNSYRIKSMYTLRHTNTKSYAQVEHIVTISSLSFSHHCIPLLAILSSQHSCSLSQLCNWETDSHLQTRPNTKQKLK